MATAPTLLANVTVTSTQSIEGYDQSLTVMTLTGASVGTSATASGSRGAPGAVLMTTKPGSLVFGVGNDWDRAIPRTIAAGQTMLHEYVDTRVGDTFWVQRVTQPIAAPGTLVAIGDIAPIDDRWNVAAVEIVGGSEIWNPDRNPSRSIHSGVRPGDRHNAQLHSILFGRAHRRLRSLRRSHVGWSNANGPWAWPDVESRSPGQ